MWKMLKWAWDGDDGVADIASFILCGAVAFLAFIVTVALAYLSLVAALALWTIGPLAVIWWRYRKAGGGE